MPSVGNPSETIRIFSDLDKRFSALEYETSSQEDFITAIKQLERLRAVIQNVFGSDSQYLHEILLVKFRYPRAKQKNAISYFNGDKIQTLTVLQKILDELRVAYPNIVTD